MVQARWAEAVGEELMLMRAAQANLEQDLAASSKEKAQLLEDLQAARYTRHNDGNIIAVGIS